MAKLLRISGLVLAALTALAVVALAVGPGLLPLKPWISEGIGEYTGRPVKLEEASLALFGGGRLRLTGLVVEELPEFGDRPLAKLDQMEVRLALWPLLTGRIVVESVLVDGLELSLVRSRRGLMNVSSFPQAEVGLQEKKVLRPTRFLEGELESHAKETRTTGWDLLVQDLLFLDSRIVMGNLATDRSTVLPITDCRFAASLAQEGVGFELAFLAPGLELKAANGPRIGAQGYHEADVVLHLDLGELGRRVAPLFGDLACRGWVQAEFRTRGPRNAAKLNITAQVADLFLSSRELGPKPLSLADLSLTSTGKLDLDAELADIGEMTLYSRAAGLETYGKGRIDLSHSPSRTDFQFNQIMDLAKLTQVLAPLAGLRHTITGKAQKVVRFKGAGDRELSLEGKTVAEGLTVSGPGLEKPWTPGNLSFQYKLESVREGQEINVQSLALSCDPLDVSLAGKVELHKSGLTTFTLNLDLAHLDLDGLAPLGVLWPQAEKPATPAAPAPAGTATPGGANPPQAAAKASGQVNDPAEELRRILATFDLKAEVRAGLIRWRGHEVRDLTAAGGVKDLVVELKSLSCRPLGGVLEAEGGLDATPAIPQGRLDLKGQRINLTPEVFLALRDVFPLFALPLTALKGAFDLESRLTFQGAEPEVLQSTLKGTGRLVNNGEVGIDLDFLKTIPGLAPSWSAALDRSVSRRLKKLSGDYNIDVGVVNYTVDMEPAGKDLTFRLEGHTRLRDGALEARLKLDGRDMDPLLRAVMAPDGSFPVILEGTLDRPIPQIRLLDEKTLAPVNRLLKNLLNP